MAVYDTLYPAVAAPRSVSLDTLAFIYIFPPFGVMTELSSASYYSCQAHLASLRIAIDPGHFGGHLAFLEKRYVDMTPTPSTNFREDIQFDEGSLAYLTAKHLKALLEHEGVTVMITRPSLEEPLYHLSFYEFLEDEFSQTIEAIALKNDDPREQKAIKYYWSHKASLSEIFTKLYNPLELYARAEKINAFQPDLTCIIHYNLGEDYDLYTGQTPGTETNMTMAFIPGSFLSGELDTLEEQKDLARLLANGNLEFSRALSSEIVKQFHSKLEIPYAPLNYTEAYCMPCTTGVFARNLLLTRTITSPVCYGEVCFQDNFQECIRLTEKDFTIDGTPCSSRLKEAAEAYFQGICAYLLLSTTPLSNCGEQNANLQKHDTLLFSDQGFVN